MSHCGGICGIEIDCPNGCGVFCTSDCTDCTQWCEPTTVEASAGGSPGLIIRITRGADGGAQVRVGEAANRLDPNRRTHPETTGFKLSFNDIPRSSLARLIGNMHPRAVRARDGNAEERLSGQATGTIAELAAKFDLLVD